MHSSYFWHFIIFFGIFSLAVLACHYYVWRRMAGDSRLPVVWRQRLKYLICFLLLIALFSHAFRRTLDLGWARPILFIPYVWLIVIMLLGTFVAACDVVRTSWVLLGWAWPRLRYKKNDRVFWARSVAVTALAVVTIQSGVALYRGHKPPAIKRVDIVLSKLPPAMNGFTIAQITDLHLGLTHGAKWSRLVTNLVNEQHPDLIVLTGDTVDRDPPAIIDDVAPLAALSAPSGVYYVTGNHEYYADYESWRPIFTNMGHRALHNEWTFISRDGHAGFALLGLDDQAAYGGFNVPRNELIPLDQAMRGIDPSWETVLLVHRPEAIAEAAHRGIGLMLSGHTHGGQVWPFGYIVQFGQMFIRGLHAFGQRTQIYVSQGAGYWGPPMRLASENEIILLRLHAP